MVIVRASRSHAALCAAGTLGRLGDFGSGAAHRFDRYCAMAATAASNSPWHVRDDRRHRVLGLRLPCGTKDRRSRPERGGDARRSPLRRIGELAPEGRRSRSVEGAERGNGGTDLVEPLAQLRMSRGSHRDCRDGQSDTHRHHEEQDEGGPALASRHSSHGALRNCVGGPARAGPPTCSTLIVGQGPVIVVIPAHF